MSHFKFDPWALYLLRWVPFDAVKPLLDQKSYVVLSDSSLQQNGESSPLTKVPNDMELEHNADFPEEPDDVNMDEDGEMAEAYSDSSDEDLDSDSNGLASSDTEDRDVTNILIGIGDSRMRYKVYTIILLLRCAVLKFLTYKFMLEKQKYFIPITILMLVWILTFLCACI